MFSLIITVISIALVAALALATLYYGGAAFNKGSAEANASKVVLQGQQLLGAAEMYFADHNTWPSLQQLQDSNYLKQIPTAGRLEVLGAAHAAGVEWTMPIAGQPVFLLTDAVNEEECAVVNQKGSLQRRGVLLRAFTSYNAQCYEASGEYKVLFKKFASADSLTGGDTTLPGTETEVGTPGGDDWRPVPDGTDPDEGGDPDGGGPVTETPPADPPTGPAGSLAFNPGSLNMGVVPMWASAEKVVTLTNTGEGPLSGLNYTVTEDGGTGTTGIDIDAGECQWGRQVWGQFMPGEQCNVYVTFAPAKAGTVTARLDVTYADGTGGLATLNVVGATSTATVAAPPPPSTLFVHDTFTAPDGSTLVAHRTGGPSDTSPLTDAHFADIGQDWFSPYFDDTGWGDCADWVIQNGQATQPDWNCWPYDRFTLNRAVAPVSDYEVSAEFTIADDGTDGLDFWLYGRGTDIGIDYGQYGYDSVSVNLYGWNLNSENGRLIVELRTWWGGNAGAVAKEYPAGTFPMQAGKHTIRLVMVGNRAAAYIDTKLALVHDNLDLDGLGAGATGMAGFAWNNQNGWYENSYSLDNFQAGIGVNAGHLPPPFVPTPTPMCEVPRYTVTHLSGGYNPSRLGIDHFLAPPGRYNGVDYPNGWAYERTQTGTQMVACP